MTRQMQGQEAQLSTMRQNMADLKDSMIRFEEQKEDFRVLLGKGFFDVQDRVAVDARVKIMQRQSGLINARYSIPPLQVESNEKAEEAGYKVIITNLDFTLEALDDADVYSFISLLNYGFPGHVSIRNVEIERDGELNYPTLRKIGSGGRVSLIKATVKTEWRTMVPDSLVGSLTSGGPF